MATFFGITTVVSRAQLEKAREPSSSRLSGRSIDDNADHPRNASCSIFLRFFGKTTVDSPRPGNAFSQIVSTPSGITNVSPSPPQYRTAVSSSSSGSSSTTTASDVPKANAAFERGEKLEVGALDDHLLHLEEHRLYALQQSFGSLMKSDPEKCKPMLEHIEAHRAALAKETGKETEE